MPGNLKLVGSSPEEEYDRIFKGYPRREGKTRGRKVFAALLKEGCTVEWIAMCVKNYLKIVEQEGRDKKYVKHQDTLLRNLDDYSEAEEDAASDLAREILNDEL